MEFTMRHLIPSMEAENDAIWRQQLCRSCCLVIGLAAFVITIVLYFTSSRTKPIVFPYLLMIVILCSLGFYLTYKGYTFLVSFVLSTIIITFSSLAPGDQQILQSSAGAALVIPACMMGVTSGFTYGLFFSVVALAAIAGRAIYSPLPWSPQTTTTAFIIVVVTCLLYVMDRLIMALEQRNAALKHASIQLADLEVARERTRIAQDLHDVTNYYSAKVMRQLHRVLRHLDSHPDVARLEVMDTIAHMKRLQRDTRDMSVALRHGNVQPLEESIRALASSDDQLAVVVTATGAPYHLPEQVAFAAYRIAQEGITNTIKHAPSATQIMVTLAYHPDRLVLTVADNGRAGGQAAHPSSGNGLIGIRERVEELDGVVVSGPTAHGFQIDVELPTRESQHEPNPSLDRRRQTGVPTHGAERS